MQEDVKTDELSGGKPPEGSEKDIQELISNATGGRVKSVDELIKSYSELEKTFTQKSQYLSNVEAKLEELMKAPKNDGNSSTGDADGDDDDQLFWRKPKEVLNRTVRQVVSEVLDPLTGSFYESHKEKVRAKYADFGDFEPQIDLAIKANPHLRNQPDAVEKLYKSAKAIRFVDNEETYEKQVIEKYLARQNGKVVGGLEGGGASSDVGGGKAITLSDEEKTVAKKFHPELSEDEAYKVYAAKKVNAGGR